MARGDLEDLRKSCASRLSEIQRGVWEAGAENPQFMAWGQFEESAKDVEVAPTQREDGLKAGQTGVYGTSAALKVLALDLPKYHDAVKKGRRWLRHEFRSEKSKTRRENDDDIIFKRAALYEALAIPSDSDDGELPDEDLCDPTSLWSHRNRDVFSDHLSMQEPSNLATCVCILSVLPYPRISTDEIVKAIEVVVPSIRASAKTDGLPDEAVITELSIALLAVSRCRQKRGNARFQAFLTEQESELGIALERRLRHTKLRIPAKHIHLYHVPKGRVRNKYAIFMVHPLAGLALITAGRAARNTTYLSNVARKLLDGTTRGLFVCPPQTSAAIADQAWIAEFMKLFAETPDLQSNRVQFRDRVIDQWSARSASPWTVRVLFVLLAAVAVALGWYGAPGSVDQRAAVAASGGLLVLIGYLGNIIARTPKGGD